MRFNTLLTLGIACTVIACTPMNNPKTAEQPTTGKTTSSKPLEKSMNAPPSVITNKNITTDAVMEFEEKSSAYAPQVDFKIAPAIGLPPQSIKNRENYANIDDNPIKQVAVNPVSTFSVDVDSGAYANVRRFLNRGQLPHPNAVRAEELINYFDYDYAPSRSLDTPFALHTEIAPTPWNKHTHLLHIGIKGYQPKRNELPPANLVFLLDVSGSMDSPDKLGLLKSSLKMLTKQMRKKDKVAIVVYAGASGEVLKPTAGHQTAKITRAFNQLRAGGSTNGGAGIQLAYDLAQQSFVKDGVNRVILATDGDFNVGTTDFDALKKMVADKRKTGIALTTLGFGTGNYNDHLMEQLADAGDGNYAYIDTLNEARKVLVDELNATLLTIAKDVKIQIEFNPSLVAEYRLIGYENRQLKREDFNNDKVDAGDIGAGHTVTALYEISLTNSQGKRFDPLRYGKKTQPKNNNNELAFLRLRYKRPNETSSRLIEKPLMQSDIKSNISNTSNSYQFSASVAVFAQLLRDGKYIENFSYADVINLAKKSKGSDENGFRSEFINLVKLADSLSEKTSH